MAKNNLTAELQELIQYIKTNYQEGVDFEIFYEGKVGKEKKDYGAIDILSPNLKKYCCRKFKFPFGVNNECLDFHKKDGHNSYYYRIRDDKKKNADTLYWQWNESRIEQEEPKNCEVCGKLTFEENGRFWLWDKKTVGKGFGQDSKVIAYLHPECAKRKIFNGWRLPSKSDIFPIKEKILRNLYKISFDQGGHLANAELLKKPYEYGDGRKREAVIYNILIDGEEINLTAFNREEYRKEFFEIRNAIVNNIKQTISDWEIKRDENNVEFLQNKKNGVKVWKIIFCEIVFENGKQDWDEIESLLKGQVSLPDKNKSSTSEEWENQIKEYFRNHDIHTITLEGNNLIIKYNGGKEEILEADDLQLLIIKQKLAQSENHSLTFPELKPPVGNNSFPSKSNNHNLVLGLAVGVIGGAALTGIVVFLLSRRRKNKFCSCLKIKKNSPPSILGK